MLRAAILARAAKNDVVGSDGIAAPVGDALDRCLERRILERLDLAAVVAHQMVVMVAARLSRLEARDPVSEVDALDETEPVETLESSMSWGSAPGGVRFTTSTSSPAICSAAQARG